jgi:6-pyruvoyltetrahydropterin/6-carboxytetrahydropterin synthase
MSVTANATAATAAAATAAASASTQSFFCATARFEAARQLTMQPAGHPSGRLHGHGFVASVRCALPAGWAAFAGGEVDQLQRALHQHAAALDHRLLNDQLPQPTDAHLSHWLRERLALPGMAQVGIRSTPQRGAEVDGQGHTLLWRRYAFHSAHRLPQVPAGHKCGRMHGHGFEVTLHVRQGASTASSTVPAHADLHHDDLDAAWAPMHQQLNYACLNDMAGLGNPTSELLASWLWTRMQPQLPGLAWITVHETGSCGAVFDGTQYRIWKDLTLDSAVQLKHAPDGSGLRRLHGHTYTLRLHLATPLDQLMGWTVDLGDVKTLFTPIFNLLDHQPLHEIADLADCDAASIGRWVLERARRHLPQLDRVDVFETAGCGAITLGVGAALALPI